MNLAFHPAAREEARQAYLYYADIDEDLARDFEKQVARALAFVTSNPLTQRVRRFNVRRYNLVRFKHHYIAYMIHREGIVVIAIGHSSRRPHHWYRRPKDYRENY